VDIYEKVKAARDRPREYLFPDDECVRDVNGGFNLERDGGVRLGQLYDYIIHEYVSRGEGTPSVRTTIRKYVTEPIDVSDRTKCVVRNGEVCRPEQLPNQPVADCDAFGDPGRAISQGSWSGYLFADESSEEGDSEQEGDGERSGSDGDEKDEEEGKGGEENDDDDNDEGLSQPLLPLRVNAYMSSRVSTHEDDLDGDGDDEVE